MKNIFIKKVEFHEICFNSDIECHANLDFICCVRYKNEIPFYEFLSMCNLLPMTQFILHFFLYIECNVIFIFPALIVGLRVEVRKT